MTRKLAGSAIAIGVLVLSIWFASGLPRTLMLRGLSTTPGLIVYADETVASPGYRQWTSFIDSCPIPAGPKKFLLQYCEAGTSSIVVRSLHPVITDQEIKSLKGMELINFLDIQAGEHANQAIDHIVRKAPNLRILHLQGNVDENGLRKICKGLPNLEEIYLANAIIENPVPELETGLLNLQGITFDQCELGRGFTKSLATRPDVKIAMQ
ncbi:MAG: hypothetical protein P1U89_20360 [Verrucomicrobiales bacterium]|nr:hypothetical protein [Verrucomicrobiales bacterium]